MNFKTLPATCLVTVLSAGAVPAMAQEKIASQTYTYGTQLDINRVISVTEDSSGTCDVVSARMIYLDSMGDKRALTYSKLAENCNAG